VIIILLLWILRLLKHNNWSVWMSVRARIRNWRLIKILFLRLLFVVICLWRNLFLFLIIVCVFLILNLNLSCSFSLLLSFFDFFCLSLIKLRFLIVVILRLLVVSWGLLITIVSIGMRLFLERLIFLFKS